MDDSVRIAPIITTLTGFLQETDYSKVLVITDNNTKKYCYELIKDNLPKHSVVSVSNGEAHKTLATCEKIWEAMTRAELDRHALGLNIGGGVVGDMGGFCAAVYKLSLIHI